VRIFKCVSVCVSACMASGCVCARRLCVYLCVSVHVHVCMFVNLCIRMLGVFSCLCISNCRSACLSVVVWTSVYTCECVRVCMVRVHGTVCVCVCVRASELVCAGVFEREVIHIECTRTQIYISHHMHRGSESYMYTHIHIYTLYYASRENSSAHPDSDR